MTSRAMMYDEGLFSARPAASVGNGYVYFATDTGNLYRSNGSAWTLIAISVSGAGVTYGTPAVVLGTAAAAGSTDEAIRRDSTIVAFDATVPVTQAFGDSAAAGAAAVAARRDHKHAMPADPFTGAAAGGDLAGTYPNPLFASQHVPIPHLKTGSYWYVPSGTISTQTLTVNNLYVSPVWLEKGLVLDRIGIVVVSNTANSTFNPAIYADTGNYEPGARLVDGGSLDTHTTAGNKEASINWTVPANGIYWIGGVPQTAVATMSCFSNVGITGGLPLLPYGSASTFPGGNFTVGYSRTGVTGTPPDPFSTPSLASLVPRMTLRIT